MPSTTTIIIARKFFQIFNKARLRYPHHIQSLPELLQSGSLWRPETSVIHWPWPGHVLYQHAETSTCNDPYIDYDEDPEMNRMMTWTKRLILTATILALIATNVLTLTHTAFNAVLSGLMGTALGIRTVSSMMQTKLASQNKTIKKQAAVQAKRKAATRKFGTRLASRSK